MPKFNKNYKPSISIFIPCKGLNDRFENSIRSYLKIKYPSFRLFFIVETEDDPAFPVIKKIIKNSKIAKIVVAGKATECGQKNKNLIEGIKASKMKDDVYAFFDSDIPVTAEWLTNLVLPLSSEDIAVSTGFEWINLTKNTIGELMHSLMNCVQFIFITYFPFQGIWGGSMAVRRKYFEKLGMLEIWSKTVVDDMSLQQAVIKDRKKMMYVPGCMSENTNPIEKISDVMIWFKRQTLFVKLYLRSFWLCGMLSYPIMSLSVVVFPFSLAYALYSTNENAIQFTILSGVFTLLIILWCYLIKNFRENDASKKLSWILNSPLVLILATISSMLTIFENKVTWSGIEYKVDYWGKVKSIVRK